MLTNCPELDLLFKESRLRDMRRLMQSHGVAEETMESTAMYWIPIWRVLEPHFRLKLVNPYFIKQLPGRKSDVKDQWIAECTMKDLVRGSFVSPEDHHRVCRVICVEC